MDAQVQLDEPPLFRIKGQSIAFDLSLLPAAGEVVNLLPEQLEKWGGRILDSPASRKDVGWCIALYDPEAVDTEQLEQLAQGNQCICIIWTWVLDCHKHGRYLGPIDDDFAGKRYHPKPSSPASTTQPTTRSESPFYHSSRESQLQSTSYSSPNPLSHPANSLLNSSASSSSMPAHGHDPARVKTSSPVATKSHKRRRSDKTDSASTSAPRAKRSKRPSGSRDALAEGSSSMPQEEVSSEPPSPPKIVVEDAWFGHKYTDGDRDYLKRYVEWMCKRGEDPGYGPMFKDMAKRANHHTAGGWKHLWHKNEKKLMDELPDLRKLYVSDDSEDEAESSRAQAARRVLWKPKETYLQGVVVPEEARRALIRFMANAPEGVTQEDLLQNFTHENPQTPGWRVWQRLIRENQESFDKAIKRKRAALQARAAS